MIRRTGSPSTNVERCEGYRILWGCPIATRHRRSSSDGGGRLDYSSGIPYSSLRSPGYGPVVRGFVPHSVRQDRDVGQSPVIFPKPRFRAGLLSSCMFTKTRRRVNPLFSVRFFGKSISQPNPGEGKTRCPIRVFHAQIPFSPLRYVPGICPRSELKKQSRACFFLTFGPVRGTFPFS